MKVDSPRARLSDAPTRVNTRSTMPTRARRAGTNEPICAMTTMSAVCRITVDLPAMLGPVITMSCASSGSSVVSLGTKRPAAASFSTTGWRPSSISRRNEPSTSGRT